MATDRADTASSCFSTLVYDTDTGEVAMVFIKGGFYVIPSLPGIEWERWKNSGSLGAYFNSNIRGNY